MSIVPEWYDKIRTLASTPLRGEDPDFNARDDSGGNFDDCYAMGIKDGKIALAREVIKFLKCEL